MMVANRDAAPIPMIPKTTAMNPSAAPMGCRMRPYERLFRTPGRLLTVLIVRQHLIPSKKRQMQVQSRRVRGKDVALKIILHPIGSHAQSKFRIRAKVVC